MSSRCVISTIMLNIHRQHNCNVFNLALIKTKNITAVLTVFSWPLIYMKFKMQYLILLHILDTAYLICRSEIIFMKHQMSGSLIRFTSLSSNAAKCNIISVVCFCARLPDFISTLCILYYEHESLYHFMINIISIVFTLQRLR
jgi:hypothetical protein